MIKIKQIREEKNRKVYIFYCPACKQDHHITNKWKIDLITNTISPSVLFNGHNSDEEWEKDEEGNYIFDENRRVKGFKKIRCHSFIKNGMIQYLNDCTHSFKGQTIPMVELK